MKILVVSLLRLGDILMATSVLRSLKKDHPEAELHILINKQFEMLARLIPHVDKVYCFDRQGLQDIIGRGDRQLLEAYHQVDDLVTELGRNQYDQVLNLT